MRGGRTRYGLWKYGYFNRVSTEKDVKMPHIYELIEEFKLRLHNFLICYSPTCTQLIIAIKIIPCGSFVRAMTENVILTAISCVKIELILPRNIRLSQLHSKMFFTATRGAEIIAFYFNSSNWT